MRRSGTDLCRFGRLGVALGTLLGLILAHPIQTAADTLDRELLKNAAKVLQYLKDHRYQTVGALKFRVKKGDAPFSDRVGSLNLNLPTRLELALLLTMDLDHPVNIIRYASGVAARLPGADHLSPNGRRALFAGRYRLAWGSEQVQADAFLTGDVIVSSDLRSLDVGIMGFGRESDRLDEVVHFTATTDPPVLIDVGESFQTRGFFDEGRVRIVNDEVIGSATKIQQTRQPNPIQDPSSPVRLEVYYDNRHVPVETRGGDVMVREPHEGQNVTFVLRKVDDTPAQYGVVLMVNGRNTLYKERANPRNARKWILNRKFPEAVVQGFLAADQTTEAFRILSPRESLARSMDYGPDVGTIQLVVYRGRAPADERKPGDGRDRPDDERKPPVEEEPGKDPSSPSALVVAEDEAVMDLGAFPTGLPRPENPEALRFQLHSARRQIVSRGMMTGGGTRMKTNIQWQTFDPEPIPIVSAKITYYRPR